MLRTLRAIFGRLGLTLVGVVCLSLLAARLHGAQVETSGTRTAALSPAPTPASPYRALLNQYCVSCHNDRLHIAGLTLETIDTDNVGARPDVWEKVLLKVRGGEMPPVRMPRPEPATLDKFSGYLEAGLDEAAARRPNPGRVAIHRLNRTEYANAIRDLLGLEIEERSILVDEDPGASGFDNTAGSLSVSPALVERYISTARKISRLAVGDPTIVPVFDTYKIPKLQVQDGRAGDDLPFVSRGGIAIYHRFPVDGEYVVKVRLQSQLYQYIIGLGRPHVMEVRLDGARLSRFAVGGDAPGRGVPDSYAGDAEGEPDWEKYMHFADAALEVRFQAQAGRRLVGVSFAEFTPEPEGVRQPVQTGVSGITYNHFYYDNPRIETVSIGGPYDVQGPGDTLSRQKVFVCRPKGRPDELACARKILATLARRAYRRPITEEDTQTLLGFYKAGREGATFDAGIQSALTRILVDPEFLVRVERDPVGAAPGTVYRISDLALASRLSFFLWSSVPDDQLLDLAARGKLRDPRTLMQQVRRMFADARSNALTDNFASQWLNLPKLRGVTPDPDDFPDFDENLREAFQQETKLFLESQMRADGSVVDLLSANYTFLNERLARHYGVPGLYGNGFRRVTLTDEARAGLLGHGSLLTVTSYANRTSPVYRGKWVLENLLGTPPPEPPPNAGGLKENEPGEPAVSVRQRLEQHRKSPFCSSCHSRMDPLGFSLENFDAIGKWRTSNEDGTPIDASDTLPDGTRLNGVEGLRTLLLSRRQQFAGAFTEKLLSYALGRNIESYDLPAVRRITREAAADDYRWSSIIEGIVKSVPFQMSIVTPTPASTTTAAAAGASSQRRSPER